VKKIFLALLVLTLAAGGAFAQISMGFGGNLAVNSDYIKLSLGNVSSEATVTTTGVGLFAFFDASFVEVDIGLLFGSQKSKSSSSSGGSQTIDGPDVSYLTLGVYGKYPIAVSSFTLFPMLGIQLDIGLSAKQTINGTTYEADSKDLPDALNMFWVKLGVGADFNLSDKMYIRPSFLFGLNFGTKDNNDAVNSYKSSYGSILDVTNIYSGLDIRVALGFRL